MKNSSVKQSNVKSKVRQFFKKRFDTFLRKRIPANNLHRLNNKKIFILPSKFGVFYLCFIFLLFLLGTNYQNNLIMLVCYVLISFFITSMLQSFYNLSGLQLHAISSVTGYAKQRILITIKLQSNKARYDLHLNFEEQSINHFAEVQAGEQDVDVGFLTQKRGVHRPGRMKIRSNYGFGLFTTWSQLDLACEIIAYPTPLAFQYQPEKYIHQLEDTDEILSMAENHQEKGNDDFHQLTPFQQGQPYTQVAWKQLAKGQGWYSKQYQQQTTPDVLLSLNNMPAHAVEHKISQLCFLILEYHQLGHEYRVELGDEKLGPQSGEAYLHQCLSALAYYPKRRA